MFLYLENMFPERKGIRNCSTLSPEQQGNQDSQETYYQIYKNAKIMVEFLRKFENRGIEIARVN